MKKYICIILSIASVLLMPSALSSCTGGTNTPGTDDPAANTTAVSGETTKSPDHSTAEQGIATGIPGSDTGEDSTDTSSAAADSSGEITEKSPDETTQGEGNKVMNNQVSIGINYTIGAANGNYSVKSSRFATESYISVADFEKITIAAPYKMTWIAYDASKAYLGNTETYLGSSRKWLNVGEAITSASVAKACKAAAYIRVAVCSESSTAAFTVKDLGSSAFQIKGKAGQEYLLLLPDMPEYKYKNLISGTEESIGFQYIATAPNGQDGAIYGNYYFRMTGKGTYTVSDIDAGFSQIFSGKLDLSDNLTPHSNAVFFGSRKYAESDEFPLLYSNIYNTYQSDTDKKLGMCCVYRLTRSGNTFATELVQILKIGFTTEKDAWISSNAKDVRPYGNFACDTATGRIYAFVPLDEAKVTRIFGFDMPDVNASTETTAVGAKQIKTYVFSKESAVDTWTYAYTNYPQGATVHHGVLYSLEGFNHTSGTRAEPGLKLIDLASRKLIADIPLYKCGLNFEPEYIAWSEKYGILFSDTTGMIYKVNGGENSISAD